MTDDIYYKELHAAARNYDIKLWGTLVSFLVVVGWILSGIEFEESFIKTNSENIVRLFFAGLISLILLIKFVKEHGVAMLIQDEINRLDKDKGRIPLYSSPRFLELLEEKGICLYSIPFEKTYLNCEHLAG